jgi:hypothetical protein
LKDRDPKGLYERALRGELKNFTGISDPYEAPVSPDVRVQTDREGPEESADRIIARLDELGYIDDAMRTGTGGRTGRPMPRPNQAGPTDVARAPAVVVTRSQLELATWIAMGLLAPVHAFMSEREAHCVQRERRRETGGTCPAPLVLGIEASDERARAARHVSLGAPGEPAELLLEVDEWWAEGPATFVAGAPQVLGPSVRCAAADVLQRLATRESRDGRVGVAIGPGPLEETRIRAAMDLFDSLVVIGSTVDVQRFQRSLPSSDSKR